MGFLLGAFGKLAAGRRVRDLQSRLMNVQTRMRRATRQVERMSKSLEAQKKQELSALTIFSTTTNAAIPGAIASGIVGAPELLAKMSALQGGATSGVKFEGNEAEIYGQYSMGVSQAKAFNEAFITQQKSMIEERYETLNDLILEPLKMEEDSLQTEKDSLESQLQIAQADYEACKKMEQADAKNLAPNYTGQG